MKKICYIVAMEAEARPFIEAYNIQLVPGFFDPLPSQFYEAEINGNKLYVVLNGRQHGMDLVGCEPACVATQVAIQRLHPDLVVSSGTCGGFKSKGAQIADVYIGNGAIFHDRRVSGDDRWGVQGLGNYPVWEGSADLAGKLGLKMGKVTTGSSLDMQPIDRDIILEHGGELKDMEGAAVGFVCQLYSVPVLYVKSVTDLCDGDESTYEEFSRNLKAASEALRQVNERIIRELLQ